MIILKEHFSHSSLANTQDDITNFFRFIFHSEYSGNNFQSTVTMWGEEDSNLRRRKPADLQSAPVGHLGILPASRAPAREGGLSQTDSSGSSRILAHLLCLSGSGRARHQMQNPPHRRLCAGAEDIVVRCPDDMVRAPAGTLSPQPALHRRPRHDGIQHAREVKHGQGRSAGDGARVAGCDQAQPMRGRVAERLAPARLELAQRSEHLRVLLEPPPRHLRVAAHDRRQPRQRRAVDQPLRRPHRRQPRMPREAAGQNQAVGTEAR